MRLTWEGCRAGVFLLADPDSGLPSTFFFLEVRDPSYFCWAERGAAKFFVCFLCLPLRMWTGQMHVRDRHGFPERLVCLPVSWSCAMHCGDELSDSHSCGVHSMLVDTATRHAPSTTHGATSVPSAASPPVCRSPPKFPHTTYCPCLHKVATHRPPPANPRSGRCVSTHPVMRPSAPALPALTTRTLATSAVHCKAHRRDLLSDPYPGAPASSLSQGLLTTDPAGCGCAPRMF